MKDHIETLCLERFLQFPPHYLLNNGTGWTNDTGIDSNSHIPGGSAQSTPTVLNSVPSDFIRESAYFDGNDLGKLGNIEKIPTEEEITIFVKENFDVKAVLSADDMDKKFQKAKEYLVNGKAIEAWKLLLAKK